MEMCMQYMSMMLGPIIANESLYTNICFIERSDHSMQMTKKQLAC